MFSACQTYGTEATRRLFGADGFRSEEDQGVGGGGGGRGQPSARAGRGVVKEEVGYAGGEEYELIPALVNFVRAELEDWERRRYSEVHWLLFACCWFVSLLVLFCCLLANILSYLFLFRC